METTKSPASTGLPAGQQLARESRNDSDSCNFANFDDNTALNILQVLADLYCAQNGLDSVKVTLAKAE